MAGKATDIDIPRHANIARIAQAWEQCALAPRLHACPQTLLGLRKCPTRQPERSSDLVGGLGQSGGPTEISVTRMCTVCEGVHVG